MRTHELTFPDYTDFIDTGHPVGSRESGYNLVVAKTPEKEGLAYLSHKAPGRDYVANPWIVGGYFIPGNFMTSGNGLGKLDYYLLVTRDYWDWLQERRRHYRPLWATSINSVRKNYGAKFGAYEWNHAIAMLKYEATLIRPLHGKLYLPKRTMFDTIEGVMTHTLTTIRMLEIEAAYVFGIGEKELITVGLWGKETIMAAKEGLRCCTSDT